MLDTLNIESFIEALTDYAEVKASHDKQRDEFEGYSWENHGGAYIIARKEEAAQKVKKYFIKAVKEAIKESVSEEDNDVS